MPAQLTRGCLECAANNRASSARASPFSARADQPVIVRICRSSCRLLRPSDMRARDTAPRDHSPCLWAGPQGVATFLDRAARQRAEHLDSLDTVFIGRRVEYIERHGLPRIVQRCRERTYAVQVA